MDSGTGAHRSPAVTALRRNTAGAAYTRSLRAPNSRLTATGHRSYHRSIMPDRPRMACAPACTASRDAPRTSARSMLRNAATRRLLRTTRLAWRRGGWWCRSRTLCAPRTAAAPSRASEYRLHHLRRTRGPRLTSGSPATPSIYNLECLHLLRRDRPLLLARLPPASPLPPSRRLSRGSPSIRRSRLRANPSLILQCLVKMVLE